MNTPFAEIFSRLRREKNISQRKAAEDMKISQALLSHYENGIREPRLEFIVHASEYYNVSVDYLLGRTSVKENPMLMPIILKEDTTSSAFVTDGELRVLLNSITILLEMISESSEDLREDVLLYLYVPVYKLLRYLVTDRTDELTEFLKLPKNQFSPMCDAVIKKAEAAIMTQTEEEKAERWAACIKMIQENYPSVFAVLKELILRTDEQIANLFEQR